MPFMSALLTIYNHSAWVGQLLAAKQSYPAVLTAGTCQLHQFRLVLVIVLHSTRLGALHKPQV